MDLTIPVLVSVDKRELYSVRVPGVEDVSVFRGPSLARLLDDLALHLMESVPKMTPAVAAKLAFSPYVQLRRVKLELSWGSGRQERKWKGRIPVVLDRWPKEKFWIVTLPYLESHRFALRELSALPVTLHTYLTQWLSADEDRQSKLEAAACQVHEYLDLLHVDVDLPSILPSRPKKTKPKKKSRTKEEAPDAQKTKKRELVLPKVLSQVAENLTHRALDDRLDRAFYRDALIDELLKSFEREGSSILLVGPSGVGKTAIVHEICHRLVLNSTSLQDRRDVWQVDGNRIIAGMSVVGAWEHRVTEMVNELSARQDVLFVNDLPALVFTGRSAHSDTNVADFLEPHLARGEIRILGECTPERLAVVQEEAPAFFARFRVIQVPEMSETDALHVLLHIVRRFDNDEPLRLDPDAFEKAVSLTRRFQALDVYPGKAVDLLTRVIADRSEVVRDDFSRRRINASHVVQHFARQAGLPEFLLSGVGGPSPDEIRTFFANRIVGQPEAVDAAVDIVTTVSQALNDPERPIATMLFVGPTGVGKTETTKALAQYLFGSKHRMLRFDMSEFQHPFSVARLIGDRLRPDGELTRRIQQQPFSLILLDEIEKAHPSIFDALLQVLGEGRLTNAAGRTVNFTSSVIIMTSNLGVRDAAKTIGFSEPSSSSLATHYRSAAERFFRPEFFNRIDRVVAFRPLDRPVIVPLVARLLSEMLGRQGLKRSSVLVDVDPDLVGVLVDQGFDRRYGARSVKRILEQRLAVPLSEHLVESHNADLRMVEVYPHRDDLQMVVQVPTVRTASALKGSVAPKNWKQVEARHAGLRLVLDTVVDSESWAQHQAEHTELLGAMNEEALTEAGQSRLAAIGTVQEQLGELTQTLDRFEEKFLQLDQFVVERKTEVTPHKVYGSKTTSVDEARPQRAVRPPLGDKPRFELESLELHMARIDHQVRALSMESDDQVLLRFYGDSAGPLFYTLATWVGAWGTWSDQALIKRLHVPLGDEGFYRPWGAQARVFILDKEGVWNECSVEENLFPLPTEDLRGAALSLRGRGLKTIIEPELGLWAWRSQTGPDYKLNIVRITDVGYEGDPIERLTNVDLSLRGVRRARQEGQVDGALHPNAPIIRWFENGEHVCEETAAKYSRDTARTFLQQVILRRLHAEMMTRVLAKVRGE